MFMPRLSRFPTRHNQKFFASFFQKRRVFFTSFLKKRSKKLLLVWAVCPRLAVFLDLQVGSGHFCAARQ
jgi:hypothetical protein